MNKDELKELILALILFILILPLIVKSIKGTDEAIQHCIEQGFNETYCKDLRN